ncbi:MAG: VWA domain-containing protein, partial [Silicimonas sp.]|nr:VWA domain-containing protein [Silicimonas sp.]
MSDELDDLKAAFDAATPAPDPARKLENLRVAEKNFADLQGSADQRRLTSKRGPMARIGRGVRQMLNALTTRGGLAATTALVAVGVIMVTPQGRSLLTPPVDISAPVPEVVLDGGGVVLEERQPSSRLGSTAGADNESAQVRSDDLRSNAKVISGGRAVESERLELAPEEPMVLAAPSAEMNDAVTSQSRERFSSELQGLVATPQPAPAEAKRVQVESDQIIIQPEGDTEAYANAPENPLKVTGEEPVSTFSIDVDTAAYSVARTWLMGGQMPPAEAVRVEEIVNYFPYAYPAPEGPHPFQPTITVTPSPWNVGTSLVHVGIQGTLPAVEERPALNLVFLIDTSGSMQQANKLPLLKQSFRLMLSELRPEDEVSIVTYAGSAGQVLEPTRAAERETILAALDKLEAGGSTAGQAGLQQAYQVAEGMGGEGEVTRVILATDGDFNVGLSDPQALKDFIADKRESGTYLSVLGFGRGNLDDATMQALAQNGNGQASYIDTLSEARKVLVDQLTGALFPIANDVKIQVEFNPAEIAEYRLIGYETRALNREDFNNDRIDAGDIGAGHRVTAIYEVTPVGSDAIRNGPLRYGEQADPASDPLPGELGFFKLRYKAPGESTSILIEEPIRAGQGTATDDVRFSIAMAGFGQLLRDSDYLGAWGWSEAIGLATEAKGADAFGYRAEAITLMRLAESLS